MENILRNYAQYRFSIALLSDYDIKVKKLPLTAKCVIFSSLMFMLFVNLPIETLCFPPRTVSN
ncbi:hypothetical protein T01_8476 [Trichinella spiralis]|uniref:Uncharacterized protein n=1 Tax=Trichinella spiralis TaxID=6334 RepID=A0A0V1AJR5_TRISP|nr:hypothetical protein T01_8476 [Trichinella spiralis]